METHERAESLEQCVNEILWDDLLWRNRGLVEEDRESITKDKAPNNHQNDAWWSHHEKQLITRAKSRLERCSSHQATAQQTDRRQRHPQKTYTFSNTRATRMAVVVVLSALLAAACAQFPVNPTALNRAFEGLTNCAVACTGPFWMRFSLSSIIESSLSSALPSPLPPHRHRCHLWRRCHLAPAGLLPRAPALRAPGPHVPAQLRRIPPHPQGAPVPHVWHAHDHVCRLRLAAMHSPRTAPSPATCTRRTT